MGEDESFIVGRGERPRPAVEELDGRGAGCDLGGERGDGDAGEPVGELVPQLGILVHEGLGAGEGLGRAALDEVAGESERCSGEPDQGHLASGHHRPHGLEHMREIGLRLERPEPAEVGAAAEGLVDHRAASRGTTRSPTPIAARGTTMSEKRIAASTP